MKLVILLISLGLERYARIGHALSRFSWFKSYLNQVTKRVTHPNWRQGWLGVLAFLLPIVVVTLILQLVFMERVLGILGWIFSLAVLLYCLGPDDLYHQVQSVFEADKAGDEPLKQEALKQILGSSLPSDDKATHRALTHAILIQANERFFGVILWFVLLGPLGAVLYRVSGLLAVQSKAADSVVNSMSSELNTLFNALDWIPVRLTTLLYSLMGDFGKSFSTWMGFLMKGPSQNLECLTQCSINAMNLNGDASLEENQAALAMVDRALVVVLVVVALFTLGAWLY